MEDINFLLNFNDVYRLQIFSQKNRLQVYFDASDTLACIYGVREFYNERENIIQRENFHNDRTLVQSLACYGLLGKILMTPPHQYEFIYNLQQYNPNYENPKFVKELKNFITSILDRKTSATQINRNNYEESQKAFKLVTLFNPGHWSARLYNLLTENEFLSLDTDFQLDNNNNVNIELAGLIFSQLQSGRPDFSVNNKSDSLALEYFSTMIKQVEKKLAKSEEVSIPVLFDPNSNFTKIINKLNLIDKFTIKLPDGQDCFLIKPIEFFLCYSLFQATQAEPKSDNRHVYQTALPSHQEQLEKLISLRHFLKRDLEQYQSQPAFQANDFMSRYYTNTQDTQSGQGLKKQSTNRLILTNLNKDLSSANNLIIKYAKIDFFNNVVLPCFTSPENQKFINALNKGNDNNYLFYLANETKQKEVKRWLTNEYKKVEIRIKNAYENFSSHYNFLIKIIEELPKLHDVLNKFRGQSGNEVDFYHTVGMTRFSLPSSIVTYLRDQFLLSSTYNNLKLPEFAFRLHKNYLRFSEESFYKSNLQNLEQLYELLTIIWLLEAYQFAHKLYHSIAYPVELLMLFGAIFIRDDESIEDGNEGSNIEWRKKQVEAIIHEIEDRISGLNENFVNQEQSMPYIKSYIAIAYLRFNLIKLTDNRIFSKTPNSGPLCAVLIDAVNCIETIQKAYKLVTKWARGDFNLLLYVTNIYIFYVVEVGSDSDLNNIYDIVELFKSYEQSHYHFWHFRYDDTLARYYHRISTLSKPEEMYTKLDKADALVLKQNNARSAFKYIDRAVKLANQNEDFRDVKEVFKYKQAIEAYLLQMFNVYKGIQQQNNPI